VLGVEPPAEREPADGGEGDDEPVEAEVVEAVAAGDLPQSNGESKDQKESDKENSDDNNDAKDEMKNDAGEEDAVTSENQSDVVTKSSPTLDTDIKSRDEDKSSNIKSDLDPAGSKSSSPVADGTMSPPDIVSATANLNLGGKTVDLDVVSTITIPPSSPPPDMDEGNYNQFSMYKCKIIHFCDIDICAKSNDLIEYS
jgi:hypothetical protein